MSRINVTDMKAETKLFYWFMSLVLGGTGIWAVFTNPELQPTGVRVAFILLLLIHIALHWVLRLMSGNSLFMAVYTLVQVVLSGALIWISREFSLIFALPMGLIGEAVGIYGFRRMGVTATAVHLAASLGWVVYLMGWGYITIWFLAVVPMFIFIALYTFLYDRQVRANLQAQSLLVELEAANQHLSEYAAEVGELSVASERQRMARELHDTLSQGLAGLVLQLEAMDAHLQAGRTEKTQEIVQTALESARFTLGDARRVIRDLREPQQAGLRERLLERREILKREYGADIRMDLPETTSHWPDETCASLAVIAGEALFNAARHSGSREIRLVLQEESGYVLLEVQDGGSGFDPADIPAGHFGLIGMRERAEMAGGTFEVESGDTGTKVRVRVPLR